MKYLITGITGFAGPHLASLLVSKGHKVYGLVRCSNGRHQDIRDVVEDGIFKEIEFLYGDLNDKAQINKIFHDHHFDGAFHLAAQSHPPTSFVSPMATYKANVMGSINLIESIKRNNRECKVMFCSTSEVYGDTIKEGQLIKETDRIGPANPYGVSKADIDLYMQMLMHNKMLKGFITRAFSHTGPRRGCNFSISSDAHQLAGMKDGETLLVGNLGTIRVVMDVRDTVRAYALLMETDQSEGKIFNICGDTPRKMSYFTDVLIELSGLQDIKMAINPKFYRSIDIHYQHGDTTALKQVVDWKPEIDIKTTLYDLLEYWRKKIG